MRVSANRMRHAFWLSAASAVIFSVISPAWGQATQPAPDPVPVGEVDAAGGGVALGAGQVIEGTATVIDGDELRVGDRLVRLYGIAAPDISANYGPDARVY